MITWAMGFLIGTLGINWLTQLPAWWVLLVLLVISLLLCVPRSWRRFSGLPLAIVCGFVWVCVQAHWVLDWTLPKKLEGQSIVVQGHIASLPEAVKPRIKFLFQSTQIQGKSAHIKIQLSWYGRAPQLNVGDLWQLQVRLKRPRGTSNPGGFNYEKWAFGRRIRATGYVVGKSAENRLIRSSHWDYMTDRVRETIDQRIKQQLGNNRLRGIITALTIGDKSGISQSQWQIFRATGTSHLMAISGLHIGLVSGLLFFLVGFLWRRIPRLTLTIPTPFAAAFGGLIAAIIYSALAGFALPTQRALVMISVFMLTLLLKRNIGLWNSYALALFIVVLFDPLAPLSVSFWLSFGAVGLIIYGMNGRVRPKGIWWHWGRAQWVIAIGLVPISLAFFQQASLISTAANLLAIPWVGFIVVPLSLLGALSDLFSMTIGGWLLWLAVHAMQIAWWYLAWVGSVHGAMWHHAVANGWVLAAAVIGALLLLAPKGFPGRWVGLFWLLPLLLYVPAGPKYGQIWLTLLDVGQGLATVVRTQHHVLVYDTGAKFGPNFDMGNAVVVPYLQTVGVRRVNDLVISHADNDHIGGAWSLLSRIPVDKIMTSAPQRFKKHKAIHCYQGEHWNWDGVEFQFLYPPDKIIKKRNDRSCVLRITNGKNTLLFTGDVESLGEKYLVKHEKSLLPATILVVPHHGSKTSSTQAFVNAIHPRYALFPYGYRNKYRFPNAAVVARYKNLGSKLLNSATDGAIECKIDKLNIKCQSFRLSHQYIWDQV